MKHIAEQFPLPLDDPKAAFEFQLRQQWEKNHAADAHNWTDEAMAMVWYLGRSDWDAWKELPSYERNRIVINYQVEQQMATASNRRTIRSYREACPPVPKEVMDDYYARVEEMAQQLAADWSANRPPSVFTFDPMIAAGVSMRLGRRVDAVPKNQQRFEVYP